jgi:small-conductance mechanosensitive channel
MISFKVGSGDMLGRVERIGWGQIRIRGRDARPTYIPNSHFVNMAVTNVDRVSHRKYEVIIPLKHKVSFENIGYFLCLSSF